MWNHSTIIWLQQSNVRNLTNQQLSLNCNHSGCLFQKLSAMVKIQGSVHSWKVSLTIWINGMTLFKTSPLNCLFILFQMNTLWMALFSGVLLSSLLSSLLSFLFRCLSSVKPSLKLDLLLFLKLSFKLSVKISLSLNSLGSSWTL